MLFRRWRSYSCSKVNCGFIFWNLQNQNVEGKNMKYDKPLTPDCKLSTIMAGVFIRRTHTYESPAQLHPLRSSQWKSEVCHFNRCTNAQFLSKCQFFVAAYHFWFHPILIHIWYDVNKMENYDYWNCFDLILMS